MAIPLDLLFSFLIHFSRCFTTDQAFSTHPLPNTTFDNFTSSTLFVNISSLSFSSYAGKTKNFSNLKNNTTCVNQTTVDDRNNKIIGNLLKINQNESNKKKNNHAYRKLPSIPGSPSNNDNTQVGEEAKVSKNIGNFHLTTLKNLFHNESCKYGKQTQTTQASEKNKFDFSFLSKKSALNNFKTNKNTSKFVDAKKYRPHHVRIRSIDRNYLSMVDEKYFKINNDSTHNPKGISKNNIRLSLLTNQVKISNQNYTNYVTANQVSNLEDPNTTYIKIGLVLPMRGDFGFERTASASTMAIRDAQKEGLLKGVKVSVLYRDDKCDGKEGLGVTADLHFLDKVNVFVGFPCSAAAVNAAKLVSYWNIPWIAFASAEPTLGNVTLYNTLVRLFSPYDRLGMGLVRTLEFFDWKIVAMFYLDEGECVYSMSSIFEVFESCNITVSSFLKVSRYDEENQRKITRFLESFESKARIILLCGSSNFIYYVLSQANELGYMNGEYVFIIASQLPSNNVKQVWRDYKSEEGGMLDSSLYENVLQFSIDLSAAETKRAENFLASIPKELSRPPWNYNQSLLENINGSKYALYLYDSVFVYAILADTLMKTGNLNNGTEYLEQGRNFTLAKKLTGNIVIDYKSDRIEDYSAWYLPNAKDSYVKMLKIPLTKVATIPHSVDSCGTGANVIVLLNSTFKKFPPDSPSCGFFNEKCAFEARDTIIISVVVILLFVFIFIIIFNSYRRRVYEKEVLMMRWKVKKEDVLLYGQNKMSQASLGKTLDSKTLALCKEKMMIGQYQGTNITIKNLTSEGIVLTRDDLQELKHMKDITHDHLNNFVGLCMDHYGCYSIESFCARGSLQDILDDDMIKLDENFKLSFVVEIIKGMDFLHKSQIKYHGRLKSTNILVDGRWIVKITDWGLTHYRKNENDNDDKTYAGYLWTSPEKLRSLATTLPADNEKSAHSKQKSDVYSFGIILHEIVFRKGTFCLRATTGLFAKEIIKKVRDGLYPPYRPTSINITDELEENKVDGNLLAIMDECWDEHPNKRPEFPQLKTRFTTLYKARNLNLIDNMLKMMENYSSNLEALVDERTTQLVEEKKKTDKLLYSLIPATVADKLKLGVEVDPESYPSVSIYFSDIVSFTSMAAESSPLEVVSLLNALYLMFDDIISTFNVYKVETIGDAYMVASGVPMLNEHHAREIALMSLAIREGVGAFKIPHIPNKKLKVRIGNNCGPVVAGVVGHTMPRYCLFGDTVNTASRMESTGEAMKIQLSQSSRDMLVQKADEFVLVERGMVEIKGKGMQPTFWLEGRK